MLAIRSRLLCQARQVRRLPVRSFSTAAIRRQEVTPDKIAERRKQSGGAYTLADVEGPETLIGAGTPDGQVPNDFDQATGLERLELLGLAAGVKIFDHEPLDASRKGTMEDPIIVDSYDQYRYVGCTGSPAGSHQVNWMRPSVDKVSRCWECGSVYKINYLGVEEDHHH